MLSRRCLEEGNEAGGGHQERQADAGPRGGAGGLGGLGLANIAGLDGRQGNDRRACPVAGGDGGIGAGPLAGGLALGGGDGGGDRLGHDGGGGGRRRRRRRGDGLDLDLGGGRLGGLEATLDVVGGGALLKIHGVGAAPGLELGVVGAVVAGVARVWRVRGLAKLSRYR